MNEHKFSTITSSQLSHVCFHWSSVASMTTAIIDWDIWRVSGFIAVIFSRSWPEICFKNTEKPLKIMLFRNKFSVWNTNFFFWTTERAFFIPRMIACDWLSGTRDVSKKNKSKSSEDKTWEMWGRGRWWCLFYCTTALLSWGLQQSIVS